MSKIRLTEAQLHRVIKESVKKILREIRKEPIQNTYDAFRRKGQYNIYDKRGNSYFDRAEDLRDNYNNVYNKDNNTDNDLADNPTPEEFFEDICREVKRWHGIELESGWYVEAETYGGDELYVYQSKEDADNGEEPNYRFSDNEGQHDDFVTSTDGSRSIVEELYLYGKNNDFDVEKTLSEFTRDM